MQSPILEKLKVIYEENDALNAFAELLLLKDKYTSESDKTNYTFSEN